MNATLRPGSGSRTAPPVQGRLRLGFGYQAASVRTILTVHEQQPPLKVVRAFSTEDGAALVHLHNISGGVLGGDQLELGVEVGPGARARLTTTGATRLYRSRVAGQSATQVNRVSVGPGAILDYLPDATIPFAGSSYVQQTRIELAPDAGLFWWEIIAPGRVAHGEIFAYNLLAMQMEIVADGRLVLLERMRLEPQQRPLTSLARLGPYLYLASCAICRVGVEASRWRSLETCLNEAAMEWSQPEEALWGVSMLPAHGLAVRVLGMTMRTIGPGLVRLWQLARRELYGDVVAMPRKVY